MTSLLRSISGRNKFLVSSSKYPMISLFQKQINPIISFSFCTAPWKNIAISKIGGWEFSLRRCYRYDFHSWNNEVFAGPNQLPYYVDDENEIVMKHMGSNIAFRFCGYDAMIKYLQEKETRNPLGSDITSYPSPLLPVPRQLYDTAFVGRVFIEEPGKEAKYINPIWEDIDQKTLLQQIVLTTRNERISGIPREVSRVLRHYNDKEISFTKIEGVKVSPKDGISHPLCNYVLRLYTNHVNTDGIGDSRSYIQLVITDFGWFVHLYQLYHLFSPMARGLLKIREMRRREMTMHCIFEQYIIFREIVERECKDLNSKLSKEMERRHEDEILVCFHEAKQLRIQGNLQIIPLFRRPHNPNIAGYARFKVPLVTPRKVYKLVSKNKCSHSRVSKSGQSLEG